MNVINSNAVDCAQSIVDSMCSNKKVIRVKKEAGLMERGEEKIVIAEDNRQILLG